LLVDSIVIMINKVDHIGNDLPQIQIDQIELYCSHNVQYYQPEVEIMKVRMYIVK